MNLLKMQESGVDLNLYLASLAPPPTGPANAPSESKSDQADTKSNAKGANATNSSSNSSPENPQNTDNNNNKKSRRRRNPKPKGASDGSDSRPDDEAAGPPFPIPLHARDIFAPLPEKTNTRGDKSIALGIPPPSVLAPEPKVALKTLKREYAMHFYLLLVEFVRCVE